MSKAQREKGRRFEQQIARDLRERFGWNDLQVYRGQQAASGALAPDVCSPFPLWIECKAGKSCTGQRALGQAEAAVSEARSTAHALAVVKRDHYPAMAFMRLRTLLFIAALDGVGQEVVSMEWSELLGVLDRWEAREGWGRR